MVLVFSPAAEAQSGQSEQDKRRAARFRYVVGDRGELECDVLVRIGYTDLYFAHFVSHDVVRGNGLALGSGIGV